VSLNSFLHIVCIPVFLLFQTEIQIHTPENSLIEEAAKITVRIPHYFENSIALLVSLLEAV
jgi:rRNA pseudouridine-1189 N-methylase Emg1 (Nep1/Mra1 family)